jgi:two-component system, NtrC family, response regulator GlrR
MPIHPLAPCKDDELCAEFVGSSAAFSATLAQIRRVATSEAPVLIEGETGSGKELAARAVHYWGMRNAGPFVPVNCGALPDHLLEAELFGHERGAFTDAKLARRGLVAEANGGTLFLDEVDALSAKAQVTLLRFLQDQRYRPLGSSRELSTNARLIAATNRPLADATQQGRFRGDLMYRLKILHLELPPLRERSGDAVQLAQHFVNRLCSKYGMPLKRLDAAALVWIDQHHWPGNVRELENWIHRALLMSDGLAIHATLDTAPPRLSAPSTDEVDNFRRAKAAAVTRFERDYVLTVMRQTGGNVTRAAQIAGKERRAFGKLIKKHGVDRESLGD